MVWSWRWRLGMGRGRHGRMPAIFVRAALHARRCVPATAGALRPEHVQVADKGCLFSGYRHLPRAVDCSAGFTPATGEPAGKRAMANLSTGGEASALRWVPQDASVWSSPCLARSASGR